MILWAIAVVCDYCSPMIGFGCPFLGASKSSDWTIEGGHLAERNQLFRDGRARRNILVTGATIAENAHWEVRSWSGS